MHLLAITLTEDRSDPLFASPGAMQLFEIYAEYYPQVGYQPPWTGYFIIHHHEVVGSCGFTGPPLDGRVELAYWTFQPHEGKGIASFACRELVQIAQKSDPQLLITAKTAPEHNASTQILQKNGFAFARIVQDHEIGDAWLWELRNP
ncbi:MAG: GNAT family N-acetyltransferase [Bacteroidia bacterium]|nr:GNAT family N-acetyltransferase [Bacteroidia bacterium]